MADLECKGTCELEAAHKAAEKVSEILGDQITVLLGERNDLATALAIHSGIREFWGLTEEEQEAHTRGLAIAESVEVSRQQRLAGSSEH